RRRGRYRPRRGGKVGRGLQLGGPLPRLYHEGRQNEGFAVPGLEPAASSVLARQRDDAVPAGRGRAVVLGDKDRQEILDAVLGRHLVQQLQRFRPVASEKSVERTFIRLDVLVGQLRVVFGRRQQLADLHGRVHAVRLDDRQPAAARKRRRHVLAHDARRGAVEQNRRVQDL